VRTFSHLLYANLTPVRFSERAIHALLSPAESQRFLQSTLDALKSHVAVLDADGTIIAVNRAWQRFSEANEGRAGACGVGANYFDVCEHTCGPNVEEALLALQGIREVMTGQRAEFYLEYPYHSPDQQRWFLLRVTPFEGDGTVSAVVAHENITERKLAEKTLHASEESYRRIVETALEGVWVLNSEFQTTYVNSQMAAMLGYGEEKIMGCSPLDFVFEADSAWMQGKLRGCRYGFHFQFDGRYRHQDGTELWLLANTRPIWEEGNFVGAFGMYTDITMRKQAEAHQTALLQGLHTVVGVSDELLAAPDLNTVLRRAVELGRERLGLERCHLPPPKGGGLSLL
jgi:PAS domain S-box-containing protein